MAIQKEVFLGHPRAIPSRYCRGFQSISASDGNDTIYALSTAPGRAAIAVIRISGPACLSIYKSLCLAQATPKPRVATLRKLRNPRDREQILDTGCLILYFPAPKTVTGEDVLELHVHGGPAIVRSVLEAVSHASKDKSGSIRPAEPGEFTKRAFYNNRIDLTEVEALGDALAAETEQQRRLAVSGAEGGLTQRYEEWRSILLYARGELEALIDFSEDQHFDESPSEFMGSVSKQVMNLKRNMELHVINANRGELLRKGISVALLGAPNAGKSSLLNKIVGREAAIVSAEEGTTRDIVDVSLDIQGWPVRLGDMAGLRVNLQSQQTGEANNGPVDRAPNLIVGEIEREGIRRARVRALQSDLVIVVISLQALPDGSVGLSLNEELVNAVRECREVGKNLIFVLNKIDLLHHQPRGARVSLSRLLSQMIEVFPNTSPNEVFCLSCREADSPTPDSTDPGGIHNFVEGLIQKFSSMTSAAIGLAGTNEATKMSPSEAQSYWTASLSVTHRQSQNLKECLEHLNLFLEIGSPNAPGERFEQDSMTRPAAEQVEAETQRSHAGFFNTTERMNKTDSFTAPHQQQNHQTDNYEDIAGETPRQDDQTSSRNIGHIQAKLADVMADAALGPELDIVTAAEHLRNAADCLARLTGRGDGVSSGADVEEVLGVVFEK